jgi:hypothetical protein
MRRKALTLSYWLQESARGFAWFCSKYFEINVRANLSECEQPLAMGTASKHRLLRKGNNNASGGDDACFGQSL